MDEKKKIRLSNGSVILGIGFFFLFLSAVFALKIVFSEGLIPEEGKLALSFFISATGIAAALWLFRSNKRIPSEVIAGFSTALLLATFAYASFTSPIEWSSNTLAISLSIATMIIIALAIKIGMRILTFISLMGGLLSPIIIKASEPQVFLLFLFMLLLNSGSIYISIKRNWAELRIGSFMITLFVYIIYYTLFSPVSWEKPFFYISCFFLAYMAGIIYSLYVNRNGFSIVDSYIGLINSLNFILWSTFLFKHFTGGYAAPLIIVGFVFIASSLWMYHITNKSLFPAIAYSAAGLLLLAFSSNDLSAPLKEGGLNYVVNVYIWILLAFIAYAVAYNLENKPLMRISIGAILIILLYWYTVAWEVDWIPYFGIKYIPFLNLGALAWVVLAGVFFYISATAPRVLKSDNNEICKLDIRYFTISMALIAHIVIGGLFTVQILNLWDAYHIRFIQPNMALSISWITYSSILFVWGIYTREMLYKLFGMIVIGITSIKVLFYDIINTSSFYKAIFFAILGILIVCIALLNFFAERNEKPKQE